MKKAALVAITATLFLAYVLFRYLSTPDTSEKNPSAQQAELSAHDLAVSEKESPHTPPSHKSFSARLLGLVSNGASPMEALTEIKAMEAQDPELFLDALISLENMLPEDLEKLLPLLGKAYIHWEEVKGSHLTMLAHPYGRLAPEQAAQWAKEFLVTNDRADLVVASTLADLAKTDEQQALALISQLPEAARVKAVGSLADSVDISDFDHLAELSKSLDIDGSTLFTKRLFERIGFDELERAADWLATYPDADSLPGAAAAIGMHMANSEDKVKAIEWADSLLNEQARAEAIASVYRQWSKGNPEEAMADILTNYPDSLELMKDAFQGMAEQHGAGATDYWENALAIENSSARSYATAGLIRPMIMQVGLEETQARIQALPANSLERDVAERTLSQTLTLPQVSYHLTQKAKIKADNDAEATE